MTMEQRAATCHPDRPLHSKGMCAPCYRHSRTGIGRLEHFASLPADNPGGRFMALHAYLDGGK